MKNIACQTLMTLSLILIALVPAYAVTVNIPFSASPDYGPVLGCVSGSDHGAMGIHYC